MFLTVALLFSVGIQLAKLRPTSSAATSGSPSPATSVASLPKLPVAVFNGTQISGLAKQVSDVLTNRGWEVTKVSNWQGPPPKQTTVYFPKDYQELANQLAIETNGVALPANSAENQSVLTLVVIK